MANRTISLNDLLKSQAHQPLLCTIEAIPESDLKVKITPWRENSGCLCEYSLKVDKKLIKEILPTGKEHLCCDKKLLVVEIKLIEKASFDLLDFFTQLNEKISGGHTHQQKHSRPFEYGESLQNSKVGFPLKRSNEPNLEMFCGPCPPGHGCLGCGGTFSCQPNGSTCCGGQPCPPGNSCLGCGGYNWCVPSGSSCCGGQPCPPGHNCLGCGGYNWCAPSGSSCCNGQPCPPGNICIPCGGYFWCVPEGSTCFNGKVLRN